MSDLTPVTISPRLAPHRVLAYLAAVVFGLGFGPGPFHSPGLQAAFGSDVWEDVWSYLLLSSGIVCTVSLFLKRRLALGLSLEASGVVASAFGWAVYAIASGGYIHLASGAIFGGSLCVASIWRAWQAKKEIRKLTIVSSLPVETIVVPVMPKQHGLGDLRDLGEK